MSTLGGTGSSICGQIPEIGVLPVSQSWALIEQAMRSTVFDKKVCFHASKLKNAGQNLSSCDFLCSAFNLFQEENVTFSYPPCQSIQLVKNFKTSSSVKSSFSLPLLSSTILPSFKMIMRLPYFKASFKWCVIMMHVSCFS